MRETYKVDENVESAGQQGNGYHRAWRLGKQGWKQGYVHEASDTYVQDEEPELPKIKPIGVDFRMTEPTEPSAWDKAIDGIGDALPSAASSAAKDTKNIVTAIAAFFIGLAAMKTFSSEMSKNPQDVGGAIRKTGRTVACGIGIAGVIFAECALVAVFILLFGMFQEIPGGNVLRILMLFVVGCGYYTIFGLVRVAKGKTFWVHLKKTSISSVRGIKIPKIAYIGIELLSVALLTKPILNWIDSFTVEWANANRDTISDSQLMTMGLGMLAGSIIAAAIIGFVICMLLKLITGSK